MAISAVLVTAAIVFIFVADLQEQIATLSDDLAAAEEFYQAGIDALQQELTDSRAQVDLLSRQGRYEQMDVAIFEIACHVSVDQEQTPYPAQWFTVCADPRVIPPGSMCWVEYFGWGVATAGDQFGYQVSVCVEDTLLAEAWYEFTEWGLVLWEVGQEDIFKPKGATYIANYSD